MSETTQMEKGIIYLTGAGCSANALPLVSTIYNTDNTVKFFGITDRFDFHINHFLNENLRTELSNEEIGLVDNYIRLLTVFKKSIPEFGTIDTFGKYLFHIDQTELIRLKNVMTLFFLIEQLYFRKYDSRYTTLITSLIGGEAVKMSDRITFLTWNYDLQLQIAAQRYSKNEEWMEDLICSLPNHVDEYNQSSGIVSRNFNVYHLNGVATFSKAEIRKMIMSFFKDQKFYDIQVLKKLLLNSEISSKDNSMIKFAWEGKNNQSVASNLLAEDHFGRPIRTKLTDATTLVIVGYSFPFFNRNVDDQIIESFLPDRSGNGMTPKHIYIQDPILTPLSFMEIFGIEEGPNLKVSHITRLTELFVPREL